MRGRLVTGLIGGAALASIALLSPALGASRTGDGSRFATQRESIGTFTPAATDPRLAAALARAGVRDATFRFTPASSVRISRSVTVAVRAQTNRNTPSSAQTALVAPSVSAVAPIAYNLGVAVGWKKFAVSSDVGKVDVAGLGRRDSIGVGVSYSIKRLSTKLRLGADEASGAALRPIDSGTSYSVDLGTSYALTRNLDVTVGARYRADRDRLLPRGDDRRDSQAVYVGTAFKF